MRNLPVQHRLPFVVVMAVAAAAVAGCAQGDSTHAKVLPTEVRGIGLTAELNEETGAVVLPADRFTETFLEMDLLATASSVAVGLCAAENGVTITPPQPLTDPVYVSEQYYGPWTRDQAERFGFVKPMTQADLAANGIVADTTGADHQAPPDGDLTAADWEIVDTCGAAPRSARFDDALRHVGPWYAELEAVQAQVLDDAEAKGALRDLEECYEQAGLGVSSDGSPGWPRGANGSVIDQQQIQLALASVECKQKTDFTARVAAVEARLQAPIVVKYADELVQKRAEIDEALMAARALLADA